MLVNDDYEVNYNVGRIWLNSRRHNESSTVVKCSIVLVLHFAIGVITQLIEGRILLVSYNNTMIKG